MSEQTRKQFDELKAKHPDAVLLFNVGDFYETYYDDAKTVSDVCGLTLTRVDSTFHYKEPAYMCGFPRHALDTYLPKLVRAGVRVAICDQLSKTPAPEPTTSQTLNSTEMERTIQNIPMSEIVPSPRNPRKNFDEEALQELADNIKHQGLLQPITIRPIEWKEEEQSTGVGYTPNKYEIVCGERRWRAVKLNESETIPCIVRELDDATAYEVMITENLQRKDIDPMEEAFAFAELIKTGKAADEIAQRFGKPLRFVQSRIKLASLIPEAKELVTDGAMDIGAAQIICKLSEEEQKGFIEQYKNYGSYSKGYAKNYAEGLFCVLERAEWHNAFKGACGCKCSECEYNSANAGCLFYEMKGTPRCTNKDKFKAKKLSWLKKVIEDQRKDLLKADEEFIPGKTCIVTDIRFKEKNFNLDTLLKPFIDDGYKVIEKDSMFEWGTLNEKENAEEIEALKGKGSIYRCIVISQWYGGTTDAAVKWCYFKIGGKEVDPTAKEAEELVDKRRRLLNQRSGAVTDALAELITTSQHRRSEDILFGIEQQVLCTIMLNSLSYTTKDTLGVKVMKKNELQLVQEKMQSNSSRFLHEVTRKFIIEKLNDRYCCPNTRDELIKMLAESWEPAKVVEAKAKAEHKFAKRISDIESKLTALGYDKDGKKLDF